ncbi:MAG: calcium/sodium antiporter [Eubacteriales bacterium]|nr:calcium/sodium antiporter [Lachnospiraceae bacterium]MDO5126481.1 calcium/sodium antiporter [Eubacteriales bacterium]
MNKRTIITAVVVITLVLASILGVAPESGVIAIVLNIAFIVAGFVMLIKGADIFVENASKIATKFNIPQMVIGLTIVAFGTSLPEAAVSIKGALSGNAGISVGNVIGSNIMNVLLILGVASCVAALVIKPNTLRIEIPFVILITVLLLVLGKMGEQLSRLDGFIFVALLLLFMVYLVYTAKNGEADDDSTVVTEKDTMPKLLLFVVLSGVGIVLGSNVTVDAASFIATEFGMTPRLIGLTIVAFGTSLPELVTSATAAKQGKTDIAIGNIVGSNIFNILFVVGISAVITPITFEAAFVKDAVVAIAAVVLLFLCVLKTKKLGRAGGALMLACYAGYFAYILYSNYA